MPDPVIEQLSLFLSEPLVDSPIQQGVDPIQCDQASIELTDETSPHIVPGDALATLADADDPVAASAEMIPNSAINAGSGWIEFMFENGRVPMIGDVKKPWEYSGWLLYYRLLLEEHPQIGKRWDYWWRTKVAGTILDEPIPPIEFCRTNDTRAGLKLFDSWISIVARYHSHWSAVNALLDWFLWGFGLIKQPPVFPVELNEALYRNVNLGPLLLQPFDYIGTWICDRKGAWNPHAFFPTPHEVVELMVQFTLSNDTRRDLRGAKVLDPAVGTGRMLMHASNYSLRLYGIDIDATMVKSTLVNGALYAPWICRAFPDSFFS
jgi:hypothetical protein